MLRTRLPYLTTLFASGAETRVAQIAVKNFNGPCSVPEMSLMTQRVSGSSRTLRY